MNKKAFTLAEVLITIGIIGVVAAITIPALKANIDSRVFQTTSNVFQRRLGEALKVMNSQSVLGGHKTTQEFVGELSRHIKVLKTCEPDELTKCFSKEITFNNNKIDVSTLTEASAFGKDEWRDDTDVMGIQFADGVSALLAYNTACISNPYDNDYITISGDKALDKKEGRVTIDVNDCLAVVYDTNGHNDPNADKYKGDERDIHIINVTALGKTKLCRGVEAGKVCLTEFIPEALDCTDSSNIAYCGKDTTLTEDYWAGANKACKKAGGSLPSLDQLAAMATDIYGTEIGATTDIRSGITCNPDIAQKYGISCGSGLWCEKENTGAYAYTRNFDSNLSIFSSASGRTADFIQAVCVGGTN